MKLVRQCLGMCLLWAIIACSSLALGVKSEKVYAPYQKIVLKAADYKKSEKASFLWVVSEGAEKEAVGDTLYVWAPPGKYKVTLTYIDFKAEIAEQTEITFTVGDGPTPKPPEPKPPEPKPPEPKPPTPVKSPNVLILFEEQKVKDLTAAQRSMLYGKTFHVALDARTVTGEGMQHEWRIYDQDVNLSGVHPKWEAVRKRAKEKEDFTIPWLIVFDGDTGNDLYSGPLNQSRDETIALIDKFVPKKNIRNKK